MIGSRHGNAVGQERHYKKTSAQGMENIREHCNKGKPPQVVLQETWNAEQKHSSTDLRQVAANIECKSSIFRLTSLLLHVGPKHDVQLKENRKSGKI